MDLNNIIFASRDDVKNHLSMTTCIDVMKWTFLRVNDGKYQNPLRQFLRC